MSVTNRIDSLYHKVLIEPSNADLVAELALALGESGTRRHPKASAADVASSGGPSSLSTLLCPLHLVQAGLTVPKLGVVGRPAGGIDVLGTIPGYRTHLSAQAFDQALDRAQYAHAVADETWAPADAELFRLRQEQGTQSVPALAVASLLAKKIASGVQIAGLEGRVAKYGNFGKTVGEARVSAELYCQVGVRLGLTVVVALTNAEIPYQPFIGRGEALTALNMIIAGQEEDPWLFQHADMCRELSSIVIASALPKRELPHASPSLRDIMKAHLRAQGASLADMERQVARVAEQSRQVICSERAGYVHYDMERVREALLSHAATQRSMPSRRSVDDSYPDVAGVRLLCPPWQKVSRGEPVLEFRYTTRPEEEVSRLFSIQDEPSHDANQILEVIAP